MEDKYVVRGPRNDIAISAESVGFEIYKTFKEHYHSTQPAMIDITNNVSVSYKDLYESTCRLGEWFKSNNIQEGDMISICSENSVHFFIPVISALYSAITVAPINHNYEEGEIIHSLNLVKPKIVFCSIATYEKFANLRKNNKIPYVEKIVILETLNDQIKQIVFNNFQPVRCNPYETTAAILYSSGTTGLAKGVMITHLNINTRYSHIRYGQTRNIDYYKDTSVIITPFYHAYGFMIALGSFQSGKTLLFLQKFEEEVFLRSIEKYKAKLLLAVPPLMVLLAKSPLVDKYDLSSIEEIFCGAAPLSKELHNAVKKRLNVSIIKQAYGMTETTLAIVGFGVNDEIRAGSAGRPLPGVALKVRDPDTGIIVGPNSPGELCVKSDLVMKGYYNNPIETQNAFENGWLLTGDIVYYDNEGYFYVIDRLKDLIKYKGFQVPPAELEALLLTHPHIKDAAVIGLPNEAAGELPMAFVVKKPGINVTEDELKRFVAGKVSHHKNLRGGVKFLEEIPKNASGKILRRELKRLVSGPIAKL